MVDPAVLEGTLKAQEWAASLQDTEGDEQLVLQEEGDHPGSVVDITPCLVDKMTVFIYVFSIGI